MICSFSMMRGLLVFLGFLFCFCPFSVLADFLPPPTALQQFDQFTNIPEGIKDSHDQMVQGDYRRELTDTDNPNTDYEENTIATKRYITLYRAQLQNSDPNSSEENLRLQIELKLADDPDTPENEDQPFDGTDLRTSLPVASNQIAEVIIENFPDANHNFPLPEGHFKWRARTIIGDDPQDPDAVSEWEHYGEETGTDLEWDHTYKVAVIMAETNDATPFSGTITESPCKLTSNTYSGHTTQYYEDIAHCVENYYSENSMGAVDLDIEIIDDGWIPVSYGFNDNGIAIDNRQTFIEKYSQSPYEAEREFIKRAVAEVSINLNQYDIAIIIASGDGMRTEINGIEHDFFYYPLAYYHHVDINTNSPENNLLYKITIPEQEWSGTAEGVDLPEMGVMAHELGHTLANFVTPNQTATPDTYEMGLKNLKSDLMSNGWALNNPPTPPHMSSYIKEFFGWITEDIYTQNNFDEYIIPALADLKFGDGVFRMNLSDSDRDDMNEYYLFETRKNATGIWDKWLPNNNGQINLYQAKTRNKKKYDNIERKERCLNKAAYIGHEKTDTTVKEYKNFVHRLHFLWAGESIQNGDFFAKLKVKELEYGFFENRTKGVILLDDCQYIPYKEFTSTYDNFIPPYKAIQATWQSKTVDTITKIHETLGGWFFPVVAIIGLLLLAVCFAIFRFAFRKIENPVLKYALRSFLALLPVAILLTGAWFLYMIYEKDYDGKRYIEWTREDILEKQRMDILRGGDSLGIILYLHTKLFKLLGKVRQLIP
jgi:M6 family metalloprotease-like protein